MNLRLITILFILGSTFSFGQKPMTYLALGDSYTIGESVPESESWPVLLAMKLGDEKLAKPVDYTLIAKTGWRTADLIRGIESTNTHPPYDMVSLLIGVNNQYQGRSIEQYKTDFETLLKTAIEMAGNDPTKVFAVSIPNYYYTPFGQKNGSSKISAELAEYNAIAKSLCTNYSVDFYNITPISERGLKHPEMIADDGLHPSAEQYRLWVEEIYTKRFE